MIIDPAERISFGETLIHARGGWVPYAAETEFPFEFAVFSEGATFGDPEPEVVEVPSSLLDGTIIATDRNGNRVIELDVGVKAKTAEGLARGERVLMGEVNKARGALRRNSLTWIPPQLQGRATVYEVLEAHLEWQFDDEDELLARRVFRLILTCSPFGRGVEKIVTPALSDGDEPVFVTIDSGASIANWMAFVGGSQVTTEGPPPGATTSPLRINFAPSARTTQGWSTNAGTSLTITPGMSSAVTLQRTSAGQVTLQSSIIPVTSPGQSYTLTAGLVTSGLAAGGRLGIRWYTGTGYSYVPDSVTLPANPVGTFTVTATAPADAVSMRIELSGDGTGSSGVVFSSPLLERAASSGTFFDAETAPTSTVAYRPYVIENAALGAASYTRGTTALHRSSLSENLATTPYLHVDYYSTTPESIRLHVNDAAESLTPIDRSPLGGGLYRAVFAPAATTVTSVGVESGTADGAAPSLAVHRLARSNVASSIVGTGRQLIRTIDVRGTARAPASLELGHPTSGLGQTILYTYSADESGYRPPTAEFRNASQSTSTVTADTSTASGARHAVASAEVEVRDVPVARLPEGVYEILAAVRRSGSGSRTFTWSAATVLDGTQYGLRSSFKNVPDADMGASNEWVIVSLGLATLPPVATEGEGVVRLQLSGNAAFDVDEIWLVNLSAGQLTRVNAGTYRRAWADSPTLDRPRRTIWVGNAADRSDARHAVGDEVQSWGTHQLMPGRVNAFSMTTGAINAGLSMEQYEWFMHNASTYTEGEGGD